MFGSLPPTELNFQCNRSAVRFLEASRDHLSPEVHDGFAQDPCSYPPGYTSIDRIRRSSHQGLIRDMPTFTGIFLDLKKKKKSGLPSTSTTTWCSGNLFIYLFLWKRPQGLSNPFLPGRERRTIISWSAFSRSVMNCTPILLIDAVDQFVNFVARKFLTG